MIQIHQGECLRSMELKYPHKLVGTLTFNEHFFCVLKKLFVKLSYKFRFDFKNIKTFSDPDIREHSCINISISLSLSDPSLIRFLSPYLNSKLIFQKIGSDAYNG